MSNKLEPVLASYHRCRADEEFFDTFYDAFLGTSSQVAALFENTDFKHQKLMLRESLLEMLWYVESRASNIEDQIREMGRRHKALGVHDEMYTLWLDSLVAAVKKHDPEFTPELGEQWRNAMQQGIDVMMAS